MSFPADRATPPLAAIFGCAGPRLLSAERLFFREADPLGFVLFRRNCESPDQVRRLVEGLRDCVGRAAPVVIDQEGGRVARLRPPNWPEHAAAGRFGALALRRSDAAVEAVEANARAIAATVTALGIDVVAAPVLDLDVPGANRAVLGDRTFGGDPALVARLGRAFADGLLAGGVMPVIKHLPGHGRSRVDSHDTVPVVDADRATLEATDFAPFHALADLPWGMTGHLVFTAIDPERPATRSPVVIGEVVRGAIGFDGLLLTDDLSMKALSGPIEQRAADAVAAGCDVALHCNGALSEMEAIAAGQPRLTPKALDRLARGEALRRERRAEGPGLEDLLRIVSDRLALADA